MTSILPIVAIIDRLVTPEPELFAAGVASIFLGCDGLDTSEAAESAGCSGAWSCGRGPPRSAIFRFCDRFYGQAPCAREYGCHANGTSKKVIVKKILALRRGKPSIKQIGTKVI